MQKLNDFFDTCKITYFQQKTLPCHPMDGYLQNLCVLRTINAEWHVINWMMTMNTDAHREYGCDLVRNFCQEQCEMSHPSGIADAKSAQNSIDWFISTNHFHLPDSLQCVRRFGIPHSMRASLPPPPYSHSFHVYIAQIFPDPDSIFSVCKRMVKTQLRWIFI